MICLLKREIKDCARTIDPAQGLIGVLPLRPKPKKSMKFLKIPNLQAEARVDASAQTLYPKPQTLNHKPGKSEVRISKNAYVSGHDLIDTEEVATPQPSKKYKPRAKKPL